MALKVRPRKFIEVRKVDDSVLQKIVNRIVSAVDPKAIILFGSYAYGNPDRNSDLDILVVVDRLLNSKRNLRIKIRKSLQDLLISKDIIVATVDEIEEWSNVPQAFLTSIVKKGKVLYERKD